MRQGFSSQVRNKGHVHRVPRHHSVWRTATFNRRAQAPNTSAASQSGGLGSLSVLTNTRPVDRLRFQSILVFKHFDTDGDGKITAEELDRYASYSAERFGPVAAQFTPLYDNLRAASATAGAVDMESFIDLVREQVKLAAASKEFPRAVFKESELGRLGWDSALSPAEVSSALAVFRLLDFNLDNYVKLDDLRKAQGIEREVVADKLEDADTNEDGFLSFKDFLTSYARERPVVLNMLVLLAHTAVFWLVFSLPMLDVPVRAVMCLALLIKPQLVTGPVIKLYQIMRTVIDRARAEIEMASAGGRGAAA
ncbi:hypothetical protein VOLCADRAFT_108377 [Volvox carteri f. nagariensis]|uniref:EF-hand domain-containing protein n=1 Tax=Volvox carteri f. nagariensis TaxID=3068 RepID=D8UJS4_VOLCA|nr:uncharacterized protein VOLCADRAFT_108377 [Volvox carteri f. nagariensis]EFJ40043.1 hypothetical protein VOLCADRAFT_108377 [Volvox carteri f. nagariensis]|eukprot:XP_002958912.1 hypothetical protein VOLCADRAFT_108377 [Volvox carteri f. nagariensis]